MAKYCPLCGKTTNCTDNCNSCMEEEARRRESEKPMHPCDTEPYECPFNARYNEDCRYYCGLGVDEDEPEDYESEEFEK